MYRCCFKQLGKKRFMSLKGLHSYRWVKMAEIWQLRNFAEFVTAWKIGLDICAVSWHKCAVLTWKTAKKKKGSSRQACYTSVLWGCDVIFLYFYSGTSPNWISFIAFVNIWTGRRRPQKRIENGCFRYVTRLKWHFLDGLSNHLWLTATTLNRTVNASICIPQKIGHLKCFFRCQERVDKWCRKALCWISVNKHT